MTAPRRLRLVSIEVTPNLVADDGEHLVPVSKSTLMFGSDKLDDIPDMLRNAIAELERRIAEEDQEGGPVTRG